MSPKVGPMDGLCNYMHARHIAHDSRTRLRYFCSEYSVPRWDLFVFSRRDPFFPWLLCLGQKPKASSSHIGRVSKTLFMKGFWWLPLFWSLNKGFKRHSECSLGLNPLTHWWCTGAVLSSIILHLWNRPFGTVIGGVYSQIRPNGYFKWNPRLWI